MADFSKAVAITLKNEGGFADRSATTGEVVNRGITLAFLRGIGRIQAAGKPMPWEIAYVKGLTIAETMNLYRAYFWNPLELDRMTAQAVANAVFDFGVNTGLEEEVAVLQRALGDIVPLGTVVVDGKLGPVTMRAVNNADPKALLAAFLVHGTNFYNVAEPAADRPEWIARLEKMTAVSV